MRRFALLLGVFMLFGCSEAVSTPQPSPSPTPFQTSLTAAEQLQLAKLEARPVQLPSMPASGTCPDGPRSNITPFKVGVSIYVWGGGHVFARGGPSTVSSKNAYFDVTFFTDPTVKGVVLVRGQQLGGQFKIIYVGDFAAGPVIGTDTIGDKQVELHGELAIPAGRRQADPDAAPGWGAWKVRQGIDQGWSHCVAWQIDTESGSEMFVAQG
jgi:hypothetical protein